MPILRQWEKGGLGRDGSFSFQGGLMFDEMGGL